MDSQTVRVNPATGEMIRNLTFGEQLVGLTFNPSGDPKVQKAKQLCAELADLLNNNRQKDIEGLFIEHCIFSAAVTDILKAQMMVVKSLTFKY
jgi:hypothetical protein